MSVSVSLFVCALYACKFFFWKFQNSHSNVLVMIEILWEDFLCETSKLNIASFMFLLMLMFWIEFKEAFMILPSNYVFLFFSYPFLFLSSLIFFFLIIEFLRFICISMELFCVCVVYRSLRIIHWLVLRKFIKFCLQFRFGLTGS